MQKANGLLARGFCAALLAWASPLACAQTTVRIETTLNSIGVQNDIVLDFTGQYTGSQLLLELDQGMVLLAPTGPLPLGGETSFLSLGGDSIVNSLTPNFGGGATDIPGNEANATPIFESTRINQAWSCGGCAAIINVRDFLVARITLTPDAAGSFTFLTSVDAEFAIVSGQIQNGALTVPEPATAGLFGLAAAGLITRQKKSGA